LRYGPRGGYCCMLRMAVLWVLVTKDWFAGCGIIRTVPDGER